jgi:hypothetical protein
VSETETVKERLHAAATRHSPATSEPSLVQRADSAPTPTGIAVRTPAGLVRRTSAFTARNVGGDDQPAYSFHAGFAGLTNLRHFSSVTVTASRHGEDRTWLRLSRTP